MVFPFSSPKCHLRDKKCEKRSVELYCLVKVKTSFIVDPNKDFNSLVDFEIFFLCLRHIGLPWKPMFASRDGCQLSLRTRHFARIYLKVSLI